MLMYFLVWVVVGMCDKQGIPDWGVKLCCQASLGPIVATPLIIIVANLADRTSLACSLLPSCETYGHFTSYVLMNRHVVHYQASQTSNDGVV